VKKELPKEAETFVGIDKAVKSILKDAEAKQVIFTFANQEGILKQLEDV